MNVFSYISNRIIIHAFGGLDKWLVIMLRLSASNKIDVQPYYSALLIES